MTQRSWRRRLKRDPVPALLESADPAVVYLVERDLLGRPVAPLNSVWELPEVRRVLDRQRADGSWKGKKPRGPSFPPRREDLLETFKQFRLLVERDELRRPHPAARGAAEFLFSFQTDAGDIRGMIANQYATYYTGEMLALLIRAGYGTDPRVERGLRWLLAMRQDDGGWTVPLLTHRVTRAEMYRLTTTDAAPLEPDRTKPFSHNWTDMALRAFAAHPRHRHSAAARAAGRLLKSRLFLPDAYSSYRDARHWLRFAFWWPNLLTSLRTLAKLGFGADDADVARGLAWFIQNQGPDGLWRSWNERRIAPRESATSRERHFWLGLAICRMLKSYWS
jgi:hypothetical protein